MCPPVAGPTVGPRPPSTRQPAGQHERTVRWTTSLTPRLRSGCTPSCATWGSRAHVVQGFEEAAAHPEVAASLAVVMPNLMVVEPLQALAASGALAVPPLLVYGDRGP